MKAMCLSKAQRLDMISTLPQTVIEMILCLLPIDDAARTSILSREWRYKWTTIPKLVLFDSIVKPSTEERRLFNRKKKKKSILERERKIMYMRRKLFNAIHQILLQRQGPIHEFDLSVKANHNYVEIDQILLHLSRNHTLKKLTLSLDDSSYGRGYDLPLSMFSLQRHSTELRLEYCEVSLKPIYNGLGSVTSLTLLRASISRETLSHLLSSCPSLKSLSIMLENHRLCHDNLSFMELFKCIRLVEHLTTWGYITRLVKDCVREELTTSLINLKYFCIKELGFGNGDGLIFLGILIKSSPNLEKIKLEIEKGDYHDYIPLDKLEKYSVILEEYSDVWLEHLKELEIKNYRNVKLKLEFVKFILAKSPNLKKVIFSGSLMFEWEKESETILQASRASPAEIVVEKSRSIITLNFV